MRSPRQEPGPPDLTTHEGFGAFYEEHIDAVLGFVTRRVADPHLAADLTADIFLAAMGSAKGYRHDRGVPVAWLFGIARNILAGHARGQARESGAMARLSGRRLLEDEDVAALEERIDAQRAFRELAERHAALSEPLRAALDLVVLDQLTPAEAAQALGVTQATGSIRTGSLPAGTPSRSASDAPEITREPDGALRFDPPQQAQLPALADRLKELGVRAVAPPPLPELQCKAVKGWVRGPQDDPAAGLSRSDDGRTLKVNPKAVPPGHTLVLAWAYFHPWWAEEQGLAFGVLPNEHVPYCSVDYRETFLEEQRLGRPTATPSVPAAPSP
ncbi:RNA polymerase sigma factor [Streptomyces avidinii]|uniref:RNA polymerase sigma factor n=1 Tax=Streptomyces avidinii TaxID=1895 RepID=UPI0037A361A9